MPVCFTYVHALLQVLLISVMLDCGSVCVLDLLQLLLMLNFFNCPFGINKVY